MFLRYLYDMKPTREYLPTVDELRDLPVEYVEWVHGQDANHLSTTDLIALCASRRASFDIHEWVYDSMHVKFKYSEMANEAAKVGNVVALKWIIERDPLAFPSKRYILTGLKGMHRDIELLTWVYNSGLAHLPNWESLEMLGYHLEAPEIVQELKMYQEEQRQRVRSTETQ
ncbi:hypothetical protein PSACC_03637 [Paramicrosporidium saccamoebae]|uniref:Uncharacterized protein n=1 Tax=Paramicrosporidium saccamoebae TaxID=1246581 RepID=A0A2H9TFP8_9FUNG|nr:hypothetical protein PSACC_03637 [Paramicrosporidium saccamoebae]